MPLSATSTAARPPNARQRAPWRLGDAVPRTVTPGPSADPIPPAHPQNRGMTRVASGHVRLPGPRGVV